MKRRNLILLLGGASSGAMTIGTGAFSSAQVERGVSVNVVEDDRALVGYTSPSDLIVPDDQDDDGKLTLVTVQNQFAQNISKVEATAVDVAEVDTNTEPADAVLSDVKAINKAEGTRQDIEDPEHELDPGDEAVIKATPTSHLTPETGYDVEVTVRVEGTGVTAEIFGDTETRRFVIERADQDVDDDARVEFDGGGNAEILGEDPDETVEIHLLDSSEIRTAELEDAEANKNLRGQLSGAGGDTIVGVTLDGTTYIHPQWNPEECDLDQPNPGGSGVPSDDPPQCEDE